MNKIINLFILIMIAGCTSLKPINYEKKSYNSSGKIEIRGSKQYIKVKSDNIKNPVLLYLHGGPGISFTPIINFYLDNLKEEFTFVMWDQRGTGKSDSGDVSYEFWNIDNMVEDAYEVTKYLKNKFGKKKIFILGNSWGSILGMKLIDRYPENYHAFVGTGQVVNMIENYGESYDLLYEEAIEKGNRERIKKLEKIGRPTGDFSKEDSSEEYEKYLLYKTKYSNSLSFYKSFMLGFFVEYSHNYHPWIQMFRRKKMKNLTEKGLLEVDLKNQIPKVKVPIYFAVGRKDFHTPYTLVEDYYKSIEAPYKELIFFENSAHGPEIQEPKKFIKLMKRIKKDIIKNEER